MPRPPGKLYLTAVERSLPPTFLHGCKVKSGLVMPLDVQILFSYLASHFVIGGLGWVASFPSLSHFQLQELCLGRRLGSYLRMGSCSDMLILRGGLKLRSWNGLMLMCGTVVCVQCVAVIINSI